MKNKVTATTRAFIVGVLQDDGSFSAQIVRTKEGAEYLKRGLSVGRDGVSWIATAGPVLLETNEPCPYHKSKRKAKGGKR